MLTPRLIPLFEDYSPKILVVVDVQPEFREHFPCKYMSSLFKFAEGFDTVYQVWDSTDTNEPKYQFPNQTDLVQKEYGGEPDAYDVKKLTEESRLKYEADKENDSFEGMYELNNGSVMIYIGRGELGIPGHEWFFATKDFMYFINMLKESGKEIVLVGGGEGECLLDVEMAMWYAGIPYSYNYDLTYRGGDGCRDQEPDFEFTRDYQENNYDEMIESFKFKPIPPYRETSVEDLDKNINEEKFDSYLSEISVDLETVVGPELAQYEVPGTFDYSTPSEEVEVDWSAELKIPYVNGEPITKEEIIYLGGESLEAYVGQPGGTYRKVSVVINPIEGEEASTVYLHVTYGWDV